MIELIFAIVVIGIAVMSIPSMINQSTGAILISTQQEAITAGTTKMGNIISYAWDENQTDSALNGGYSKVLDVNTSDNELELNATTGRRIGHLAGDKRRKGYNPPLKPSSVLGSDGGDGDDVDDFIGNGQALVSGVGANDYIREYNISVQARYINDGANYSDVNITKNIVNTAVGNPSNIKLIEVRVTSPTDTDVNISMITFSSNVGEAKLLSRELY